MGTFCPCSTPTLAHAGYFPIAELATLRKINSRLQGSPARVTLPGIETTSGPLGLVLSQSCGMALAARMDGKKHRIYLPHVRWRTWPGNYWKQFFLQGKISFQTYRSCGSEQYPNWRRNRRHYALEPLRAKYEAFNWHVIEIDGHNFHDIVSAVYEAKAIYEKPTVVICAHHSGKG